MDTHAFIHPFAILSISRAMATIRDIMTDWIQSLPLETYNLGDKI